jgi:uncharacterized protein (TIGR02001 family)
MRGFTSKVSTFGAAALALSISSAAYAADAPARVYTKAPPPVAAPPVFDVAIGGWVGSDYNFRGVSQSNRGPSAGAYFEGQYNSSFGTWYLGIAGASIEWPSSPAFLFTDPAAEIDFFGGWRKTWDKFSVDIGLIYYYYPKEVFNGYTNDSDFFEIYWKGSYVVNDALTVGANVFYTPDLLNYSESFSSPLGGGIGGKPDAVYASLTAKYVLPWQNAGWGSYVSGEIGHWWIDGGGFLASSAAQGGLGYVDPDYAYWNAGLALTYKAITLDFRYHGTSQSTAECATFLYSAIGNPSNRWCKDAFIATLKFDTTLSALK